MLVNTGFLVEGRYAQKGIIRVGLVKVGELE